MSLENITTIIEDTPEDNETQKSLETLNLPTIIVFGLDDASGRAYFEKLCEELDIDPEKAQYQLIEVPPRVEFGELNSNPSDVASAVVENLYGRIIDNTPLEKIGTGKPVIVSIGCNTVGVREYQHLIELMLLKPPYDLHAGRDYILWTPVRALVADAEYRQRNAEFGELPFFFGTTVTSKDLATELPTFFSEKLYYPNGDEMSEDVKIAAANVMQQTIWLDKKVNKSEIVNAPDYIKTMSIEQSEQALRENVAMLLKTLRLMGVKELYLGCTELPDAFERYCPEELTAYRDSLNMINPAVLVAQQLGDAIASMN